MQDGFKAVKGTFSSCKRGFGKLSSDEELYGMLHKCQC